MHHYLLFRTGNQRVYGLIKTNKRALLDKRMCEEKGERRKEKGRKFMKENSRRLLVLMTAIAGCFVLFNLIYLSREQSRVLSEHELDLQKRLEESTERIALMDEGQFRTSISPTRQMTALISTYEQPICLKRMVQHLRTCSVIGAIHVNWFESGIPPPDEIKPPVGGGASASFTPVVYDNLPDKISYRFFPRNFPTDAIFSVDVDTYFSCEGLSIALDTWRNHDNSAVGFHPRLLTNRGYDWWESFKYPFVRNTIFVTKGGIVHKDVFAEFFKSDYAELRAYVDEFITGEDMLMSFVLANKIEAEIFTVCLEVFQHCNVNCQENKVDSLYHRTSRSRATILKKLFDHFGNVFESEEGAERIVWQSDKDRSYCKSNNDLEGAKPPCKFCESNEVCPSNVYGRSKLRTTPKVV